MNVHEMFRSIQRHPVGQALALITVMVLLAGCDTQADSAQQAPPPPEVSVAEVVVEDVDFWDAFTGHIEATESVALRPQVSGYIERINYTEGETVAQGDVLFVIDPRPYQAQLAHAEAELQRAEATLALARGEAARAETLAQTRAISQEQLDQKRATTAQATAELMAAKATLETARLNMAYTEVRAPIAGRTGRALVTTGNLVSEATPLTSIVSLEKVHVHFFADERSYLRYDALARTGQRPDSRSMPTPVRLGLAADSGYPYQGEVDYVDNRLDAATGTIRMRAVFDNQDGRFAPGMFARVQLQGGSAEEILLIDDKAVLTDQDRKFVYVVNDDGVALRKDIRLGRQVDDLRAVESGLSPGDRVVVQGAQRIFFPGMPVSAQDVPMRAPAPDTVAMSLPH